MLRSDAVLSASRTRSSASLRPATYIVVTGMSARSASTTALRPATTSDDALAPPPERPEPRAGRPCGGRPPVAYPGLALLVPRVAERALLAAGWYSRSAAIGVGPLPSNAFRRCPPDPTDAPLPALRTAPRRWEFPGMSATVPSGQRPARPGGCVVDDDSSLGQPVANRVGRLEIPCRAGGLASSKLVGDQCVESGERVVRAAGAGVVPDRRERVHSEHLGHGHDRRGGLVRRVVVTVVEGGVARTHRVVDNGKRPGHVEVVVHRVPEGLRQNAVHAHERTHTVHPLQEARDPLDRGPRFDERALVVLDGRAVVRSGQVVADSERRGDLDDPADLKGVAQGL